MSFEEFKKHGVTQNTPKEIMLGAGTIHKNLKYGYVSIINTTKKKPSDWETNYANYYAHEIEEDIHDPSHHRDIYTPVTAETKAKFDADFASGGLPDICFKGWNAMESCIGATSGGNKLTITPNITTVEVDGALVKVKGLDFKQGEVAKLETNMVEVTPELIKTTVIGQVVESDAEGYSLIESKPDILAGDYFENLGFVGWRTDNTPIIIILDNALCTTGFEGEAKNKDNSVVKVTFECYQDVEGDLMKLPYHIYTPTPANAQG